MILLIFQTVMAQPFWNDSIRLLSEQSWLPLHDLTPVKSNSWVTVYVYRERQEFNLRPSYTPPVGDPDALRAFKIRLYPTPEQMIILKRWAETSRCTYNWCCDLIASGTVTLTDPVTGKYRPDDAIKKDLRHHCVNRSAFPEPEMQWVFETPSSIRDEAMSDLLKAYKTCFALARNRRINHFTMTHRLKNDPSQSMVVCHRYIKVKSKMIVKFFPTFMKDAIICAEEIPPIRHDCRLQWLPQLNQFYLCIPCNLPSPDQDLISIRPYERVIALDPGVRTFMTGYDPKGLCFKWGHSDINKIYRLCFYLDRLQSLWSEKYIGYKRRYRLKKAGARLRMKIRNLVDDAHKKLANFLCKHYDLIMLPKFETSQMVIKRKRKIKSKTARAMLTWAHYRFRQRLIAKAREYSGCWIKIVDEAYTSKTCGRCGHLNERLGGKKVFHCSQCELTIDRDINGARNIFLKNFQ